MFSPVFSLPPRPPPQPGRLPTQDPGEQRCCQMQKGRPQQPTAPLTQREPASVKAVGAEQGSRRPREFKRLAAASSVQSGSGSQSSSADENLLPLTARLLAAFQEIFKLFSSSPTGTVDMCSMKAALRNVGIQLSPQEMCEALQQADLDGDGTVSFKDFLGVLTDSHRLAQCLGQVRNSRSCDPQGLQTLFLEMLFKLMSQGFLSHKVVQEVMSYYKKQRALRLNPGWRGRSRGHSDTVRTHAGLTFFCQAARLSSLSSAELERSLHRLHKAGAHSPYSQIPNLAGRTPAEDRMRPRAPRPDVRLPKSCHSSRHKLAPTRRSLSPEFVGQPLDYLRPAKMTPSPPTLVQKQPFSPSPACLQKPAMKK
ncbi:EF-hand calcium-binding domain-containing protein 3-like isoform X2 [Zalophus californianus]|uniref:EF-hand calcium-binding domain-containing protein 3-like isoform X2 n=1 Tax=Zalophus californianus TaxID=9704 RepID=A0A6J2FLE4_ZALCA|nr:EF-hand calcium-binding domain-containing protein 3-like isoform X2 [Zalophus californianus]